MSDKIKFDPEEIIWDISRPEFEEMENKYGKYNIIEAIARMGEKAIANDIVDFCEKLQEKRCN